jgi:predicted glycogen debranching enzyme
MPDAPREPAAATSAARPLPPLDAEWLEADGLGGFAMGTVGGARTRRYHGLLTAATRPPTGRFALVAGVDVRIATEAGNFWLSSHRYAPGVTAPDGARRLVAFERDPWPRWTWALEDGTRIVHEALQPRGTPLTALSWRLAEGAPPPPRAHLEVRPFLLGRDYHATHHANGAFRFVPEEEGPGRLRWRPYEGVPAVLAVYDGVYAHDPHWYRGFEMDRERARGLEALEDAAAPGVFRFDLTRGEAALVLLATGAHGLAQDPPSEEDARALLERLRAGERARRAAFATPLERAADRYLVARGEGLSIVAGYPWFTDWGRDTFIAMRGLLLATGRLDEARRVLLQWAGAVSEGMLPNRFPDAGDVPEYNSVDASLWFCLVAAEWARAWTGARGAPPAAADLDALRGAVLAIIDGHERGTRFGIRVDPADGLLAAGVPGVQLTWMDAKVDGRVITPRIGKPVEVQALWANALAAARALHEPPLARGGAAVEALLRRIDVLLERVITSARKRFPHPEAGLKDVVDVDHVRGRDDASVRPNMIFAAGGLPFALFEGSAAFAVVRAVEARLLTPMGLRSLAPGSPGYRGRYEGGVVERDESYHQGTVWPWLLGPFVEAWLRERGATAAAKAEARARFLPPLDAHLETTGLGHISEIADGDPPHAPRGCPFQAWSLGERIRLERAVLAEGVVS